MSKDVSQQLFEAKQKARSIKVNADMLSAKIQQMEYHIGADEIKATFDVLRQIGKALEEAKNILNDVAKG